jgi:hypothetical protein
MSRGNLEIASSASPPRNDGDERPLIRLAEPASGFEPLTPSLPWMCSTY